MPRDFAFNRHLVSILEKEGMGPSSWRERDCITLIQTVVSDLSGVPNALDFSGEDPWQDLPEDKMATQAISRYGSIGQAWKSYLDSNPYLIRVSPPSPPLPGMIGLTVSEGGKVEGFPLKRPMAGVIGSDRFLWVRREEGLGRAGPIAFLWEVVRGI